MMKALILNIKKIIWKIIPRGTGKLFGGGVLVLAFISVFGAVYALVQGAMLLASILLFLAVIIAMLRKPS